MQETRKKKKKLKVDFLPLSPPSFSLLSFLSSLLAAFKYFYFGMIEDRQGRSEWAIWERRGTGRRRKRKMRRERRRHERRDASTRDEAPQMRDEREE
jgi:hypothetical protein